MTTLTLVLPVKDCEQYIADALVSLQANRRDDFEFIVIDDGSSDSTSDIIDTFRPRLPELRVHRNDTPVGLASARNIGIEQAEGTYVTFLDGDDWLAPGYLPQLVDAITALDCQFVRVDHVQAEGRNRSVHLAPQGRRGVVLDPRDGILPDDRRTMVDYPYAWAGIFRRDLGELLRFPPGLHTAEDRPWIWRLHREANTYAVVSLAGLFYRRLVANSLTQIGDARQLHFFDAYQRVLDGVFADRAPGPDIRLKAVRQFVGLVARHIELAERMDDSLRAELRRRARSSLDGLPRTLLERCQLSPARAQLLAPLLPPGLPLPPMPVEPKPAKAGAR